MRRPIIFLYSLPFPALWICCSLLFTTLFPGKRLGIVGTALLFMGVASLISWQFARRQGRDFSAAEYRNIILYCIGWAVLLEFCTLLFLYLFPPPGVHSDLSARSLCFIVLFTAIIDSLFVWLAFRNFGRRVIKSYLAKHGEVETKHEKAEIYETMKRVLLFFLVLVVLAVIAFRATLALHLWMAKGERQLVSMQGAYQPKSENDKSIAVVGWREDELNKILAYFRGVYGLPPSALVVTKHGDNFFQISFPDDIEPRIYFFLVNYIRYPKGFDLQNRRIGVLGRARLSPAFGIHDSSLNGIMAKIYVPANDKEFDNVYVQLESGKTFKIPFTRLIWESVDNPKMPNEIRDLQ
jgi:hypothetical protein